MSKEKRRIGRAIRKQRREQRELMAAVTAIDFGKLGDAMDEVASQIGRAFAEVVELTTQAFTEFVSLYVEAKQREYRMTHRALTTGEGP